MAKVKEKEASGFPFVPVCGIGASAGGVKALRKLFAELPPDLGLAYVVIVHLAPEHPSVLGEILSKETTMEVVQVADCPELKANCVYVIAPDQELVIEGHSVKTRPITEERGARAPIDMFFNSIASAGGDGMAVVLTGAGSDGSVGVAAVKEQGGVIFVQDPKDAEFPSMPQSAIATGVADFIAPIPLLAERMVEVARSKGAVRSISDDVAANDLRRIVNFLHTRTGHDFSSYKRATVLRRVLRRMQVRGTHSLSEYAIKLQEEPEEANELFKDMLISVTRFFRDPDAFEVLASDAIAPLLDDLYDDGLRIWVPGCATGEEAYTIAILVREELDRRQIQVPVQIFATDLDEGALATARTGLYPKAIEADVSADRLQRHFVQEGTHYRIRTEVREMVLFASHSVLKDPPFLNLDLISCRNLMIYLERQLQEKLCGIFAYALRPNRYMFLGSAETADSIASLFTPVNRETRLYRSHPQARKTLPLLHVQGRVTPRSPAPLPPTNEPMRRTVAEPVSAHLAVLEQSSPPSMLVGQGFHIVHLSPSAGKYILPSGGEFSGRIDTIARPELRLDLAYAIERALDHNESTLTPPTPVRFNGHSRRIALNVIPAPSADEPDPRALVLFLDGGPVEPDVDDCAEGPDEMRRLHAELQQAKKDLTRSRTNHELSAQELRAANEELQSINEEYRSTAEELETSKEELQSMNEELHTVNSELKDKLESISNAHSDLRNLTAATEIGTLFLDGVLRIRMFTPPVAELFNITEVDLGRPLTDFTHRLTYDGVEATIREVLQSLAPVETETESYDGKWFMMRVRPYRTIDDRIEGIVVTFIDITARHRAEEDLARSEARYRSLFNTINEGFCVVEMLFDEHGKPTDYRFHDANAAFEDQTGIADPIGKTMKEIEPDHEDHWYEAFGSVDLARKPKRFEAAADALGHYYEVSAFPFAEPDAHLVGVLFNDVSERKQAEDERQLLTRELSHRVKNILAVVQSLARQMEKNVGSVEEFREAFISRVQGMARAHDILLRSEWRAAQLKRLVEYVLSAFVPNRDDALAIEGVEISLIPKQTLGVSLILHELATNAAKYGAWSSVKGRVEIVWRIEATPEGQDLLLDWRERGGPAASPPAKKGFGVQLIERASDYELNGSVSLDYAKAGFRCSVRFPMERKAKDERQFGFAP